VKKWWHSEFVRNARLTLPPRGGLAIVAAIYLVAELLQQLGQAIDAGQFGRFQHGPFWLIGILAKSVPSPFQFVQAKTLCVAAVAFAIYRVSAYHPFVRDSYRNWLKTTCWRVGQPLPLGPVTLTLIDAFLLALATLLCWHVEMSTAAFFPLYLFALAYLLEMTLPLFRVGRRGWAYVILFGFFAMVLFGKQPEFGCLIAVPTYLVACLALRRSLAYLHHDEPDWITKNLVTAQRRPGEKPVALFSSAWPFAYLSPQPPPIGLPRFDATCLAILAGWVLFSVSIVTNQTGGFLPSDRDAADVARIAYLPCAIVAVIRLFAYYGRFRPPISFLGRVATGRWLIPSFDRGLLPPILGLIVYWSLGPGFLSVFGVPLIVETAIRFAVALLVILVPGPTYRNWALTSECRIVPIRG
jgi:hypothetical protein